MSKRLVIIGAGGHARETAWTASLSGFTVVGFVVSDLSRLGPRDSQDRVLGDFGWLEANRKDLDALALGIGTPGPRLRVSEELTSRFPELAWPALVHPSATIDLASATLERGSMVGAGVVATVNVVLREHAVANFGCTIGHEAELGRGVVVNPGASIGGGVLIGEGSLVGSGAQVLQYLCVGRRARIGAGAVVTRDVADDVTVTGIPARVRS